MLCSDVMWRDPPLLRPDEPVRAAVRRLIEANVAALPVVDENGRFLGMVTERTLVREVLGEELDPDRTVAALVLDRTVLACEPDDPAAVALKRMDETNTRWLPVVREGKLEGIVGARDIRARARDEDLHGIHPLSPAALTH